MRHIIAAGFITCFLTACGGPSTCANSSGKSLLKDAIEQTFDEMHPNFKANFPGQDGADFVDNVKLGLFETLDSDEESGVYHCSVQIDNDRNPLLSSRHEYIIENTDDGPQIRFNESALIRGIVNSI
ncbi:hypothetical protein [Solilutibacter oculi]|uniref:hypothetical protein n=1 Tax=Solilutibacter oculi TaxID=2698682 RepID=UPI0013A62063|nr:hypothetical protein [Lysobacter oculi]